MSLKFTYTEEQLISQLKLNKKDAFEYLYDHYSPALYGIIFKILKDEEKAADSLQDTFLKIWKNRASYANEKGTLFTWILNIARNTAIDKLRSEAKTENAVKMENVREVDLTSTTILNPSLSTIDLRAIVGRLLPEKKQLIELVYFQGYTHEEVSEQLSLPLGTVKSRIRRTLQELRDVFAVASPAISFV